MVARRQVIVAGVAGGAGLLIPSRPAWAAPRPAPALDPANLPKYVTDLLIPPAMPRITPAAGCSGDEYLIAVRQFRQQVLPPGHPATTVWGYGSPRHPGSFGYPARTVEATVDRPVRITWANELVDRRGNFLPHLLAVDPTLHWANPPGGTAERDSRPHFAATPGPYTGPVPIVTHLHGAHTHEECDGYPEAWYLPAARNIPRHYATVGSYYQEFGAKAEQRYKMKWKPGRATFEYANDQHAAALWYHDHAMGLTRLNVYAGPVGFYLLRGGPADLPPGVLPGPAPALGDRPGTRYYEIPLILQDRSFNADGSLYYPAHHPPVDGRDGPFIPGSDIAPIWTPGFLGNTMVVNGRTWPVLRVEPRRYRLRLLNASNARSLILTVAANPTARPAAAALPIWQIGVDRGFLPKPVRLERLRLANGERADVIVDFTGVPEGTALYLVNEGLEPQSGRGQHAGVPPAADPATTGQVMKFQVGRLTGTDRSVPPDRLELPPFHPLGPATVTRRLSLNMISSTLPGGGPAMHRLGTLTASGQRQTHSFHDPIGENPAVGATEIWEFHNFDAETHPVHLHQAQFQVLGRGPDGQRPPEPSESGFKDVVVAVPNHITRVKVRFDLPGRFVWHCHLLEHEDNEMMRPFVVGQMPMGAAGRMPMGAAGRMPMGVPATGDGSATGDRHAAGAGSGLAAAGAAVLAAAALGGAALGGAALTERRPADVPPA